MTPRTVIALVATLAFTTIPGFAAELEHFHPKGKPPLEHTLKVLSECPGVCWERRSAMR
jgi:hypothetical protein